MKIAILETMWRIIGLTDPNFLFSYDLDTADSLDQNLDELLKMTIELANTLWNFGF